MLKGALSAEEEEEEEEMGGMREHPRANTVLTVS